MKLFSNYFKIIFCALLTTLLLRSLETYWIFIDFGYQNNLLSSELFGLILDLCMVNLILVVLFPLYYILSIVWLKFADLFFFFLVVMTAVVNFLILHYFVYQLLPLDIFVYKHSLQEIQLTVETSSVSYFKTFFILMALLLLVFSAIWYISKKSYNKKTLIIGYSLSLLSVIACIAFKLTDALEYNLLSLNKAHYFYAQSYKYFTKEEDAVFTKQDAIDFQKLHSGNSYFNTAYPMLHTFEKDNVLGSYFNAFDTSPNIVIVIVEGLNDDFIHPYHKIDLMPYLSRLKNESLYWSRCFTLGERSFAAVPSITGSLPYGDLGFMQTEILPRHLSLGSILESNHYQTAFFYGQAKWFHNKGKYFEYNHVDTIIDNATFDKKYNKIVVGAGQFFWGYNDKDLFNQSLEVIDKLPNQKRFDVYFTGTSHSPFIISDTAYYEAKFYELVRKLKTKGDISFFNTHKKYILSEMFTNDAIENFMDEYKKRTGFDNTIFIITGDHPMTELPRANALKKYHVPLLIYSPRLKSPKIFSQTASHLDIYESLLSLLSDYNIKVPEFSTAIGGRLNITTKPRTEKIAFMNDTREVFDYLSGDYFISGNQLYKVQKDLSLHKSTDKFREAQLKEELRIFNKVNLFVCESNKLLPDSLYCNSLNYSTLYSQKYDSIIIGSENHILIETKVPNDELVVELSFRYNNSPDQSFAMIYELKDNSSKFLIWQHLGVVNDNKKNQYFIKIPKQKSSEQSLSFKMLFNNPAKQNVKLNDLRILVYKK